MTNRSLFVCALTIACVASVAHAAFIVEYSIDAGGTNTDPLNGLAARATFDITGTQLTITLENISTDIPVGFTDADCLLVSIGFELPNNSQILTGDSALIAPTSCGVGSWSDRGPGASVGDEWLWTNGGDGDLLSTYPQIISTSSGMGGAATTRFDGLAGSVDGPWGGMAGLTTADNVPNSKPAVTNSIVFTLTLTSAVTEADLETAVTDYSMVEFGSDTRYLTPVPEPATLSMLAILAILATRRRA